MEKAALVVETEIAAVRPDYRLLAVPLLDEMRAFYSAPENEKAFQEWKATRDNRKGGMCKHESTGTFIRL